MEQLPLSFQNEDEQQAALAVVEVSALAGAFGFAYAVVHDTVMASVDVYPDIVA
jgi:hypothetical protein